jgi:lipopolysaccharide biosynthesis protein
MAPPTICVHIYYDHLAPAILDRLQRISADFSLVVTGPALSKTVEASIRALGRPWKYLPVENRGRDVRPFLLCLPHVNSELLCKVHTKGDDPRWGSAWRDACLDALIGSTERFQNVINAFKAERDLAIVGPELVYKSARYLMFENQPMLEEIAAHLDVDLPDDWGFFAGTMFWARRSMLEPIMRIEHKLAFDAEGGEKDGQLAHALERAFGLLAATGGSRIGTLSPERHDVSTFPAPGNPSRSLMRNTFPLVR